MADYRDFTRNEGHSINCIGPWACTCDVIADQLAQSRPVKPKKPKFKNRKEAA